MKTKKERVEQLEIAMEFTMAMNSFFRGVRESELVDSSDPIIVDELTDKMLDKSLRQWATTLNQLRKFPDFCQGEIRPKPKADC